MPDARVGGIGQVALPARDVDAVTAFYRDVLGLPLLFEAGGMAFFDGGGVRIMVSRPEGDEAVGAPLLYYRTPDLDAAHRVLVDAGAEVVSPPHLVHADDRHELHIGFYRDVEGNLFGLMREIPVS